MGPWESESTDMCHGAIAKDGSGGRKAGGLTEPTAYQSICTYNPSLSCLACLPEQKASLTAIQIPYGPHATSSLSPARSQCRG